MPEEGRGGTSFASAATSSRVARVARSDSLSRGAPRSERDPTSILLRGSRVRPATGCARNAIAIAARTTRRTPHVQSLLDMASVRRADPSAQPSPAVATNGRSSRAQRHYFYGSTFCSPSAFPNLEGLAGSSLTSFREVTLPVAFAMGYLSASRSRALAWSPHTVSLRVHI